MSFQQFSERPNYTTSPQEQEKWKEQESLKWPAIVLLSISAAAVVLLIVLWWLG